MVAGFQIYLATLISYDMSGAIDVSKRHKDKNSSSKTLYDELSQHSDFGKLISDRAFKQIIGMGVDAVAGVRWAAEMQKELCQKGKSHPYNRKGFLINKGLCLEKNQNDDLDHEEALKVADAIFSGQTIQAHLGRDREILTSIKPTAILENPIKDLKTLNPVFNECGNIQSVADGSIGGLFPKFDGNAVLASDSKCGK